MNRTILFGGLPRIYEILIKGAVESLGYKVMYLPEVDNESLSTGKEYCNRGMCNPSYYTIGNLIKFLKKEAEKGVDVENAYAFVTVGACGPCRFGMYEMEYRYALKEAGFKNFTVSTLNQSTLTSDGVIDVTPAFIWRLVKAIWVADIIRDVGYQIRPYEMESGSVDKVINDGINSLYMVFKSGAKIKNIMKELKKLKRNLENVKVTYHKPKPIVSVIGEFWAHTTESEGNYKIHRWLESEGAEVKPEPVAGWIDYQLFMEREKLILEIKSKGISKKRARKLLSITLMSATFKRLYNLFRMAFNMKPRELPSQKLLRDLSKDYYDHFVVGGEGHLEVAKHIYNIKFKKAHMVLAVKPFGCMPSTQSDGVQVKVTADFPESIFVSVETSGDSEINVKSRIQMKLFEAKKAAVEEYHNALKELGLTEHKVQLAIETNPLLQNPFTKLSKKGISKATKFIYANKSKIMQPQPTSATRTRFLPR